ncbi:ead/Ea22-like family protein [Escherichia coli]|uniref:ead/Ea22-like family protein n=1 Tax=Escherichia coli TaxID=562 RepID=UPI0006A623B6|nr:ead/Ea22-like family protein [Escherichia coli]
MSEINYQALREIAKQATQGEWVAFISPGTGTYAVHTPGDKRCEDVIKWTGFDGQKNAENNARYIAAFNPEVVQALLDENESMCRDLIARNGEIEGLRKLVAELEETKSKLNEQREYYEGVISDGSKRIAELESDSQAQKLVEAIIVAIENEQERLFDEDYLMDSKECIDVIREEVKRWNDSRAAGIRIKGE